MYVAADTLYDQKYVGTWPSHTHTRAFPEIHEDTVCMEILQ